MKTIHLISQLDTISGGLNPFQIHACQSAQQVWHDNYLTCRNLRAMFLSLNQYQILPGPWIDNMRAYLPDSLKSCSSWEQYLLDNPGYPTDCF